MTVDDIRRLEQAALRVHKARLAAYRAGAKSDRAALEQMRVQCAVAGEQPSESRAKLMASLARSAGQYERLARDEVAEWPATQRHYDDLHRMARARAGAA